MVQQVRQTSRSCFVVSSFLISQQQPSILCPALGGGQSPFRIEQYSAGMRRENFCDQRLEFFHHGVANFATFFFGQRFLQRPALIHSSSRDHASRIGDFF